MRNCRRVNYYFLYTILFILALGILLSILIAHGKTFVRNGDALTQHYPAFLYIGRFYRKAVEGLLFHHTLPSTWDFSIGYGSDIIQTLSYYGLADWSTVIFAVFSNDINGTYLYTAMMIFRAFIAGLCFLKLCERFDCNTIWSTAACIAYILCPYMLENVFNGHHFMCLPLIYMPLIFLYIDRILNKESVKGFPIVIALAALSSYYYFYMEMVSAMVFFIIRYFAVTDKVLIGVRHFFQIAIKTIANVIIGVMMSAPILAPQVASLSSDQRMNAFKGTKLLYSTEEYTRALVNILSSESFSYYSYIGLSACIFMGVLILIVTRKETWLRIFLFVNLLSLLLPFAGKAMNGFSYVANRHVWIWILLLCLCFAISSKEVDNLKKRGRKILIGVYLLYMLALLLGHMLSEKEVLLNAILLLAGIVVINIWPLVANKTCLSAILLSLVIIGTLVHIRSVFVVREGFQKFMSSLEVEDYYNLEHNNALNIVEKDKSNFRVDWNYGYKKPNSIDTDRVIGSTYQYWSFENGYLMRYLKEHGLLRSSYEFDGLDNRYYLRSLLGCKYVVDPIYDNRPGYKSLGYNDIYENCLALPIARLYDRGVDEKLWMAASFGEKEVIEANACVIDRNGEKNIDAICEGNVFNLEYSVNTQTNKYEDGTIIIVNNSEPLRFSIDCPRGGELFFGVYNLSYNGDKGGENAQFYATCNQMRKSAYHYSPYDKYYFGNKDYLLNFDYSDDERKEICLYFENTGCYKFDKITIEYIPYSEVKTAFNRFDRDTLRNIVVNGNEISMDLESSKQQLLYCAIPFSTGWKARLDDTDIPVFNANIMGIGVDIPDGNHRVLFKYSTPLFAIGFIIFIAGSILYLILLTNDGGKFSVFGGV